MFVEQLWRGPQQIFQTGERGNSCGLQDKNATWDTHTQRYMRSPLQFRNCNAFQSSSTKFRFRYQVSITWRRSALFRRGRRADRWGVRRGGGKYAGRADKAPAPTWEGWFLTVLWDRKVPVPILEKFWFLFQTQTIFSTKTLHKIFSLNI